ncbi:MAG TPA: DUF2505 domain-containing protein [Marmoricola sp.]|jgi:hypothetical protein|nr:DUF2505 domain-containing protein [Marmoricola sp.]
MKLRHEHAYDAAPAAVLAMMTEPGFWDLVAVATAAISSVTTVEADGGATRVVTDSDQPVVGVPSFAKKFAGDSARAITTAVWSGSTAAYTVDTPGKPTTLAGTITVTEASTGSIAGSTVVYDLELKASVPLIGGKLERLMGQLTSEGFDKEHAVGVAWLAGER